MKKAANLPLHIQRDFEALGENLRACRKRRGKTIDEVAELIGCGRKTIMNAEKGSFTVSAGTYEMLKHLYDVYEPVQNAATLEKDKIGMTLLDRGKSKADAIDTDF